MLKSKHTDGRPGSLLRSLAAPAPATRPPSPPAPPSPPPWVQLDAAQPRASYEGGQRRCFERMYVCGANFLAGRGLSAEEEAALSADQRTAAVARQVPVEPYAYGQAVALHMQQQRQQQARRQRQDGAPDAITLQALVGEAAGAPPLAAVVPGQPRARTAGRLRIMLMKRGDEGRQISNAAELLQRCNSWRYVPPGGGPAVGAECSEVGAGGRRGVLCWHVLLLLGRQAAGSLGAGLPVAALPPDPGPLHHVSCCRALLHVATSCMPRMAWVQSAAVPHLVLYLASTLSGTLPSPLSCFTD